MILLPVSQVSLLINIDKGQSNSSGDVVPAYSLNMLGVDINVLHVVEGHEGGSVAASR